MPVLKIDSTQTELAYIAGLVDGEGSIHTHYRKCKRIISSFARMGVAFTLATTDRAMAKFISDRFMCQLGLYSPSGLGKKMQWRVCITGSLRLRVFLQAILPYLVVKRRQAELALEIISTYRARTANHNKITSGEGASRQLAWVRLRGLNQLKGRRVEVPLASL